MSAPDLTPARPKRRDRPKRQRGDVIKQLRLERRFRSKDFAAACELGVSTLWNIEGEHTQAGWLALYAIAKELGVPVRRLLRDPNEKPGRRAAPDIPRGRVA